MTDAFRDAAPAWAGGPYSIKQHGVTVTNCDSEPVQTPGCIQAHGVLLVLRPEYRVIRQVSENCERLLGRAPGELLDAPLATVLGADVDAKIAAMLAGEPIDGNPMHVLTLEGRGAVPALELVLHTCDRAALLELEPAVADRRGPTDDYAFVTRSVARLQASSTLLGFCQVAADEVRALTGLDRVMIYKFHDDGHGEVFAESRPGELPAWLGLHYPAEDIPRPVREIFRQIWIRPVPDARAELAELVPLCHPDTGKPLTMTHCALRGPSVMYTEYLENMGVRASLTMPIRRDQELWGLIACHHREPAYLPYPMRAACELMAQVVSLQHKAAEDREHVVYRMKVEGVHQQLVAIAAQDGGLAAMMDSSPNLLDGVEASGAALFHRDRWWCAGRVPAASELENLRRWLVDRPELRSPARPLYVTDALARDYPPAADLTAVASGLLAVSLSRAHHDMMLWFRPETIATVQWGGNPHDMPTVPGPHGPRLTPRKSFELFVESVRGRSPPWRTAELESALRLRLLVTELVIGRAEHLARTNVELARSNEELDAFAYVASHDLKEPLRGINQYAHQLLDDALEGDAERRSKLEALVRLTVRMDSLLDALLEFSRVGRTPLHIEDLDLGCVVEEALDIIETRRAERGVTIVIPRPLPVVPGDHIRLRQVFVNLLSNAIKYNDRAEKRIEIGYIAPDERPAPAGWPAGHTAVYVKDNGIGIEPRHRAQVFEIFRRLHGRDEFGGGAGAGLTIVKKVIAAHGGHVWLDSEVGVGSTFYVSLPTHGSREVTLPAQPVHHESLSEPAPSAGHEPWRIVVIDDNPDDRAEVRRLLLRGSRRRYTFSEAGTAALGVRAVLDVSEGPPHCVVLDYYLPDANAPQVLEALTGAERLTTCPVVVLTGSSAHDLGATVLRAGAQDYVGKAWLTAESLTRAIENAVERHAMVIERQNAELALARAADERGRARDALEASLRFAEQFVGVLGHDLRNPLQSIIAAASLLHARGAAEPERRMIARIQASAERMTSMVAQLLDLTRLRLGGGIVLDRSLVSLHEIVADVVDELHQVHPSRRIVCALGPEIRGEWDAERLSQVVSNLVGNAIQYGDPAHPIDVTITPHGDEVALAVHSVGPPIPRALLPAIFEPYRRGERRSGTSQGLGLGLYIAHQIVLGHGGNLDLDSTEDGHTTFTVVLHRSRDRSPPGSP